MTESTLLASRQPSVAAMLTDQVRASGTREALRYLDGDRWFSLSWEQVQARVFDLAAGLLSLGLAPEDRVAIDSGTRLEWVLADLAVMCAGGATTTVYPNTQHEDVAFILGDSGSRVVFAEDHGQVAKVLAHLDDLPDLELVVQMTGTVAAEGVISWEDLLERGRAHLREHPDAVTEAIARIEPEHLATLIYTSGTTGRPKGVRLVQDNWTYLGAAVEEFDIIARDDLQYLWLPLSHVFGKVLIAAQLRIGFATAVEGDIERIVDNLAVVQPTFMAGAPRIFEKVRSRVMTAAGGGAKGRIFAWAFSVGRRTAPIRQAGGRPTGLLALQQLVADRLVFSKIKNRMGGKIRFFVSGSAALNREVQEWFYAAGLLVLEGYGLTETGAASCVNNPRAVRFGTVGPPMPGTEVKIADDGEVLLRGPAVMRGYHHLDEATAEVLDADGWFATGDMGELDAHGYLRITDRKKDLIKTSGGKYVAPQKVEGTLKAACPYISQVLVHGEGRKYITALITLDAEALQGWADQQGLERTGDDLVGSAQVRAMVEGYVAAANQKLERWETVKKFELLPNELSIDEGEVTPSLKIRRKAVEKKYDHLLEGLYEAV